MACWNLGPSVGDQMLDFGGPIGFPAFSRISHSFVSVIDRPAPGEHLENNQAIIPFSFQRPDFQQWPPHLCYKADPAARYLRYLSQGRYCTLDKVTWNLNFRSSILKHIFPICP